MVKICPKCGTNNDESNFWCNKCSYRLINNGTLEEKSINEKKDDLRLHKEYDLPYDDTVRKKNIYGSMLKIPIAIAIVAILIFASFYFITNLGDENFDWDRFGGCPWDENFLPWDNSDFPWVESLDFDNIFDSWGASHDFSDIGEMNKDYWFEEDSIVTNTGWTFTLTKVEDCSYTAKVLDYYVYNKDNLIYQPSELFSQVDIFLGFDDIINNPEKYPYDVESYFYRGVYVRCTGSSEAQAYFYSHVTNTHIIPHSQEVLNKIKTIGKGDIVTFTGSYVNVHGQRDNDDTTYSWNTDTNIGDSNCEIILLDSISIS